MKESLKGETPLTLHHMRKKSSDREKQVSLVKVFLFFFCLVVIFMLIYERCPLSRFEKVCSFSAECNEYHSSVIIASRFGLEQLLTFVILTRVCHRCYFFSRCDGRFLILNRTCVICLQFHTSCSSAI